MSGNNVIVGVSDGNFISTDNGKNFTQLNNNLPYGDSYNLEFSNTDKYLLASNGTDIYFSTDNGLNWKKVDNGLPATNRSVFAVSVSDTNLFAATNQGVFVSTDEGNNWSVIDNSGLPNEYANAMVTSTDNIFWGGSLSGVWQRPISQVITSVQTTNMNLPSAFKLSQNYPNPFNPTTTIQFAIPQSGKTELQIYNSIGQLIAEPVNKYYPAGNYSVNIKAGSWTSGIYYYRIISGNYTQTKKMILLK